MKRTSNVGIAMVASLAFAGSAFAADLKVGGFVNGQYTYNFSNSANNGFYVPEAALTLSKDTDGSTAMFVLPFSLAAGGGGFAFGNSFTQAFVGHKYTNGVSWKLGKFEKMFGNEGIYASVTPFTSVSPMNGTFYNSTHTGLMVGFATDGMDLKLLVADNSVAAGDNASIWGNDGPDLGLRADFGNTFYVGGRYRFQASGATTDYMINAGLKMDSKPLLLGLDAAFANSAAAANSWGVSGLGLYGMSDTTDLGARVSYVNAGANTLTVTVGPQFKMTQDLRVKVNYNLNSVSGGNTTHSADVSGVFML